MQQTQNAYGTWLYLHRQRRLDNRITGTFTNHEGPQYGVLPHANPYPVGLVSKQNCQLRENHNRKRLVRT